MEAEDLAGDGRTFKADFTAASVDQLCLRVREKLCEFVDVYTNDNLVTNKYVGESHILLGKHNVLPNYFEQNQAEALD
ncbi:hypothetical protein E2562_011046 [Oryza meyeriana var. granulata]|uniref:Uncharacterized protein n=1 Tax=Oryza meyeriana var. granulata TaxID=110450 RepID=A0A6G1EWF4_9ORYZ|nr:hypothetical protein E2562_011046 [Oryza meyeriana var. granulata]